VGRADAKNPGLKFWAILAGGRVASRREESRLGLSQRAGCQRLRDSSTTPRWLKSRYPQPSLICSTLPEDALPWPLQRQGGQIASSTSRRPPLTV
jgi:hypothetical protein